MVDDTVVAECTAQLAAELGARTDELTAELIGVYDRELPQLVHDDQQVVSLLAASLYQNIDTCLRIFQHNIDPSRVEAPAAAMEYARRLAQRGTPVIDLIRAYQLGQTTILDYAMAVGTKNIADPELLGAMGRRAMSVTFAFIDRVTQQVVAAYEEERDRWLLNRNAVRSARVKALLDEHEAVDADDVEAALGYRLHGTHVGMIAWRSGGRTPAEALPGLETMAIELAQQLGCAHRPLFVPVDESSAWVWLPMPEDLTATDPDTTSEQKEPKQAPTLLDRARAVSAPEMRLAFGEPCAGVAGFRHTHRQARRVQLLALAAGETAERVLAFRDVGAIALLAGDLESARSWVSDTLGALAGAGKQVARLRETLRVFLAAGSSYTAAAARLTMHKNSVQYRVHKAEELLGRPVADNRLDVELALHVCHWLGAAVLTS